MEENWLSNTDGNNKERMDMLKKCAKVIKREYLEWNKDQGVAHPILQDDKEKEIKQNFKPDNELQGLGNRGMRIC